MHLSTGAYGEQKSSSDLLELELQAVVSPSVGVLATEPVRAVPALSVVPSSLQHSLSPHLFSFIRTKPMLLEIMCPA